MTETAHHLYTPLICLRTKFAIRNETTKGKMSASECSIPKSNMRYEYPTPCPSPSEQIDDPVSSQEPDPVIKRLDSLQYSNEDDLVSDICKNLKTSGGCIIRNLVDRKVLQAIEGEIRPHLNKIEPADGEHIPRSLWRYPH